MGWLSNTFKKVGGAILGGVTGGLTDSITGSINRQPSQKRMSRKDVRMGHSEDTRSYKERDAYDWQQAEARGITPQEFYGSAASGGSGSSGGAQVLGNSLDKSNQINQQQYQDTKERNKDRMAEIQQTQMQTESQQTVAKIQAGVTERGQDYTNDIANKQYQLAHKKLMQIELPKLQAELKISKQQFKLLSNQISTSTKKFTLYMKKLSMGVDNMMVEFLQHSYGVDITDPKSVQSMSPAERAAFIQHTAAINAHAFKEAAGISLAAKGTSNAIIDGSKTVLGNKKYPQSKPDDYVHGSIHKKIPKSPKSKSQRY